MAVKSTSAPARRKSKSALPQKAIYLTPELREKKAWKEFHHFLDTATEAEKKVVRHLKVYGYGGPVGLMKEIRRLLDESAAKCKVIPFPTVKKHSSKFDGD